MQNGWTNRKTHLTFWALALAAGISAVSQAAVWYVDDDAPGGDGTSWDQAFTHLQDALSAVQTGDQIWVASGFYYPDRNASNPSPGTGDPNATFSLTSGVGIYGGFLGTADPNGGETNLSQRDPSAHWTHLTSTSHLNVKTYHIVTANFTDDTAILDGFRIIGGAAGDAPNPTGGGILLIGADLQVVGCTFIRNTAVRGGAVGVVTALPNTTEARFINCTFLNNGALETGGAIHTGVRFVECINCLFVTNGAQGDGGGAVSNPGGFNGGAAILTNCTLVGNGAPNGAGGAVFDDAFSGGSTITNSILWSNVPDQIFEGMGAFTTVSYTVVEGGWPGTGNIDGDPLLCDADGPDNVLGTLDDNLRLLDDSPCIDAGNDAAVPIDVTGDFDGLERFFDARPGMSSNVDMGAYENHHITTCPWDITGPAGSGPDGQVEIDDFLLLLATWGPCPGCAADFDCDLIVGITDFLALLAHWGPCPSPPGPCDEGYVPGPGDPIPELYCNDSYRNLVLGRLVPIQIPVLCSALTLLGQPERCSALNANTYVQISIPPDLTMKFFIDDGGPALLLRFDPEILPKNPQPALIAWLDTGGLGPSNPVVVGFLFDQVIAVFAEIFDTVAYLQFAQEVVEGIETVTSSCQLRDSLTHYGEMFNFSDPGKVGFCVIECIAFVDSIVEPFGFGAAGAAANIVRMFFYYACGILCDDFAYGMTAGLRADVRSAILFVRNEVPCP